MNTKLEGLVAVHVATLLLGLAGLFGKFLSLSPVVIVFGRAFFAAMTLYVAGRLLARTFAVKTGRDLLVILLLGMVLAAHWVAFFHSIQLSTVALGLLAFSTFPIFVTLLEPVVFAERLRPIDIGTAILVIIGVAILVRSNDAGAHTIAGIFWGVVSGLVYAFLQVLNRKLVMDYSGMQIACLENLAAMLLLLPVVVANWRPVTGTEILLLAVLGVFCTALAHTLFLNSLASIKAQLASVIVGGLEPVYAIVLAVVLLDEVPGVATVVGGLVILGAVVVATSYRERGPGNVI